MKKTGKLELTWVGKYGKKGCESISLLKIRANPIVIRVVKTCPGII